MESWTLVDVLRPAAERLGVQVTGPVTIRFPDKPSLTAEMLVHGFGARNGMVVHPDFTKISPFCEDLIDLGYGYSSFRRDPPGEYMDVDGLVGLLSDWGWAGDPAEQPHWIIPIPANDDDEDV